MSALALLAALPGAAQPPSGTAVLARPSQQPYVLPDPAYAHRAAAGDPARARVRHIVYPTLGFPALVPYGGELEILVRTARESGSVADWRGAVRAGEEGPRYPMTMLAASYDPAIDAIRLRAAVPARAPRDVYDLELGGPGGLFDTQPRAVRIYGSPGAGFRFALMADHQLWDPSWKQKLGDQHARPGYPRRGEKDANRAIERQVRHELSLLDPDFVLDAGDLVFGLDYGAEYDEFYNLMRKSGFASFAVPGNHDGYAIYDVHLRGGPLTAARAALQCREPVSNALSQSSWGSAWHAVVCLYGNVKPLLFQSLSRDGIAAWRKTIGPPYYAFDYGPLHVVGLDTYDGSPERRHAYALYVDAFDLHLGAPAVDNYGGYLGDAQLRWLEADLAAAAAAGKTIVLFGHHDPRGNLDQPAEARYTANLPFPTDPLSLGGFKEWNYDSDWGERAGRESARDNSATRLLRLVARYASAYLSAHVHKDGQRAYEPGEELAPGVRAERRIEFVRVTAAAGAPSDGKAYWGYRLFEVAGGGRLSAQPYDGARAMLSVPAGNVWLDESAPVRPERRTVVSGHARPLEVSLRFRLPERPEGYRFSSGATLVDVGEGGTYFVRVQIPAAPARGEARLSVDATPAAGNRPPAIAIEVAQTPVLDAPVAVVAGQPVHLSGERTTDPDGVLALLWTLPDGQSRRGLAIDWVPTPGRSTIAVEAIDRHGARAHAQMALDATEPVGVPAPPQAGAGAPPPQPPPPAPRPHGCGCQIGSAARPTGDSLAILSLGLPACAVLWRRRRRQR